MYFHSRVEGDAEILGSERAWMSLKTLGVACAFIPVDESLVRLQMAPTRVVNAGPRSGVCFRSDLQVLLGYQSVPLFQLEGEKLDNFQLVLNTAIVAGSDPLALMAR